MRKILLAVFALLLLCGCSGKAADNDSPGKETDSGTTAEAYVFNYNGTDIAINAEGEALVKALGEPLKYFEEASCAFEGIDKTYIYKGFELTLYPNDSGVYRVWSIYFTDDTVATAEGISLGMSLAEVKEAYGTDYTEASGQLIYLKGETRLAFIITDEKVTSIEYTLAF
jgi:hypothetical protein